MANPDADRLFELSELTAGLRCRARRALLPLRANPVVDEVFGHLEHAESILFTVAAEVESGRLADLAGQIPPRPVDYAAILETGAMPLRFPALPLFEVDPEDRRWNHGDEAPTPPVDAPPAEAPAKPKRARKAKPPAVPGTQCSESTPVDSQHGEAGTETSECLSCGLAYPASQVGCPACVHGPTPDLVPAPELAPERAGDDPAPLPLSEGCRAFYRDREGHEWRCLFRWILGPLASIVIDEGQAGAPVCRFIRVDPSTVRRDPADRTTGQVASTNKAETKQLEVAFG